MRKYANWNFRKWIAVIAIAALGLNTVSCKQTDKETSGSKQEAEASEYEITEENENLELTMNTQPESSYWFPEELLAWSAADDADLPYNISVAPLAKRADKEVLQTVNATQNKDTQIMAISIMNSSTSGNAPRGLNKVGCNTFSYWQYVDVLVYWGGSSGEGLIVAPSPDVVDAGHKNGVKVIGTIFFPQAAHGGKLEWLDTFLNQDASGNFPIVDKLIEVAKTYGFDGWFINQESEGTKEEPLTADHAKKMQALIKECKTKAPEMTLIYYDSMTVDGKMDWQNALTEKNMAFLKDESGNAMADSMFLNFWWTEDELASQELLKNSAAKAQEAGIDPYSLYAGVDIQSEGYLTPVKWNLFENPQGGSYTSLGLYCPNWAYSSANDMEDFWQKENSLWVNSKGDPSEVVNYSSEEQWKGVSTYAVERTAITSLPFITNFCMGNGYGYFIKGEQVSKMDWNNRGISDILPTYRWMLEEEGNNSLSPGYDVSDAWYGGNCLKLRGDMEKGKHSVIALYSADLPAVKDMVFTTTARANTATSLQAVLQLDDGSTQILDGDQELGEEWTTVAYDTSSLEGKSIRRISYQISTKEDKNGYELYLGNITMAENTEEEEEEAKAVSQLTVESTEFDEDAMFTGVRLIWEAETPAAYYEIYRINQNGKKSLLGVTNTTNFFINTLPRTDDTNKSTFEVVPVTRRLNAGAGTQVTMDWPDNSLPRADFTADKTIIAPGDTVTFTSLCSANTETTAWTFTGADVEEATGGAASATYAAEGVYDVKLTAGNSSGQADKEVKGCIVVTSKASDYKLLSEGADTEASSFVNDNEAPPFAVDGDTTKKWCATGAAPHELTIDLGSVKAVAAVDITHAEGGGESPDMNTKSYTIQVSEDGGNYTDVINVTKNTAASTHDTFAPVNARFIRLIVNKPTQGSDSAARIYEVQVYGLNEGI